MAWTTLVREPLDGGPEEGVLSLREVAFGRIGQEPMKSRAAVLLLLLSTPALAAEATVHLRVVGVHDGDTITGLDESKTQYKIRLDAIDAPELGQPFGQASKKALSEMVFGKSVTVIEKKKDKYGRTIGHVLIDGKDTNLLMLEQGMAWHYREYSKNQRLQRAEDEARANRKGLWADREPMPPWEWRKTESRR
jgi:micrococcal nuclease